MKQNLLTVLALVCALTLTGCGRTMNDVIQNEPSIVGIVENTTDDHLFIRADLPEQGEDTLLQVSLDVEMADSMTHFDIGDEVEVYYNGDITEGATMKVNTVYAIFLLQPADRSKNEAS